MGSSKSEAFLQAFRAAAAEGEALEAMATDREGFAAAMRSHPEALAVAMDQVSDEAGGAAVVSRTAFAAAACRLDGRVVAADPAFDQFRLPPRALGAALKAAADKPTNLSAILDDDNGRPVALAIARSERALSWPIGPDVRAAVESGAADFAILGVRSAESMDWAALLAPWTLTRAEARLAAALVQLGDLRAAAAKIGVAYETAREVLASAMAKTGARRQPEFVRHLAQLAFGELPANDATWRTLADTYGLTLRQGRLAVLVAGGATRSAAASVLGVSDQSAKVDLKMIYERCGVASGAALGRLVAETDALARLAQATDVDFLDRDHLVHPLRFVRRRRASGRIAVEDHGPHDGTPVVVFHTPLNGRHLPRVLVQAMHARGLRPISVDRPGFGLTTMATGDFVSDANDDLIDVLDLFGLKRVRLLGRSISMPLRFAAAHPERVESGVLIGATPPGVRPTRGMFASFIALALDHPELAQGFARMAARLSSERSIIRLTERAIADSASDRAAFADPANRADWLRASRQSSAGDGFAREFVLHADGGTLPPGALGTPWTIVMGGHDAIAAGIDDGLALWKAAMPRAKFRLAPDGGRLLHLSHPDLIAEALAEA